MRIDNQLDELDKTCRRLEAALATLLIAIGSGTWCLVSLFKKK
jgi:hypothetical protein